MTHHDVLIIGSGSGNTLPGGELDNLNIGLVDRGIFGGTCLNLGCIPTKMFVHTAELAAVPDRADRFGLTESFDGADWPAIRDRIFGRIDPISAAGEDYRKNHPDNDNLTLYRGTASFTGPKAMVIATDDGEVEVTADRIVLAAGSRPDLPPIDGIDEVGGYTSDNVMRMAELPASLVILGSGFIAAEFAHIFSALGVDVTIIARSDALLRAEDAEVSELFTREATKYCTVVTNFSTVSVSRDEEGVTLRADDGRTVAAQELLIATGRRPNTDLLHVERAGIQPSGGLIPVDDYQRVLGPDGAVIDGLWALGDICSRQQLKHLANAQARAVAHNLAHPDELIATLPGPVPHAVFGQPQIGSVGLTEAQARERGYEVIIGRQAYRDIAYGWAMEEPAGFAKVICEAATTKILGAHIIGPQAATLIQLLIQAIAQGLTAADLARSQYWIHPAMPELIENALLDVTAQREEAGQ
ncbi:MAG: mycothione reductase [Flaviflexus sp.]|nr:mycothione reductase [Flaviflexus sp.]